MKKALLTLPGIFALVNLFAQDISGTWYGQLNVQGKKIELVFNIKKNDSGYISTMDSPDQHVKDIPVTATQFNDSTVIMDIAGPGINYEGRINGRFIIQGTFKTGGPIPSTLAFKRKN